MDYEERCKEINSFLKRRMVFHAKMELNRLIKELGYE